jgi:hypothetical protein
MSNVAKILRLFRDNWGLPPNGMVDSTEFDQIRTAVSVSKGTLLESFLVYSSLTATAAVHLVSSYLQSPPSTSIRPFRPFQESQPLRLRAEFLCSRELCVKSSFGVAKNST